MTRSNRFGIAGGMAAGLLLLLSHTAFAAGPVEARKLSAEMVKRAQAMVNHGDQGHLDAMGEHAQELITHAKQTLKAIPKEDPHGDEAKKHIELAIKEAEAAIDHGGQGHGEVAMKHARAANEHAEEAAEHLDEMN